MEPLKPVARNALLQAAPLATDADLEEYERLLSKRYTKDPSVAKAVAAVPDPDEVRLQQLMKKNYGQL